MKRPDASLCCAERRRGRGGREVEEGTQRWRRVGRRKKGIRVNSKGRGRDVGGGDVVAAGVIS